MQYIETLFTSNKAHGILRGGGEMRKQENVLKPSMVILSSQINMPTRCIFHQFVIYTKLNGWVK